MSVLGGKVLEHEAKRILNEGKLEQAKETALNLRTISLDEETIAKMVNVSTALVKEWFSEN